MTFELSGDRGKTFTILEEGLTFQEAGRALGRLRERRQVDRVAPNAGVYELHSVGGDTVWRWREEPATAAG
ncbi:hypothetical protein [Micromonospora maritima]|uniref:hypothetical protein n=1 Tax=Micromonospora maritima TaxID=986711 RepID=UPI00157C0227|nr:hypothetical protein [Micromonospora maritima]